MGSKNDGAKDLFGGLNRRAAGFVQFFRWTMFAVITLAFANDTYDMAAHPELDVRAPAGQAIAGAGDGQIRLVRLRLADPGLTDRLLAALPQLVLTVAALALAIFTWRLVMHRSSERFFPAPSKIGNVALGVAMACLVIGYVAAQAARKLYFTSAHDLKPELGSDAFMPLLLLMVVGGVLVGLWADGQALNDELQDEVI